MSQKEELPEVSADARDTEQEGKPDEVMDTADDGSTEETPSGCAKGRASTDGSCGCCHCDHIAAARQREREFPKKHGWGYYVFWVLANTIFVFFCVLSLNVDGLARIGIPIVLSDKTPFAQIIAMRPYAMILFAIITYITVKKSVRYIYRRQRSQVWIVIPIAAVITMLAHFNITAMRGFSGYEAISPDTGVTAEGPGDGSVTVLTLNTQFSLANMIQVETAITSFGVDIVILPETSEYYGERLSRNLQSYAGLTFTPYTSHLHSDVYAADPTTILVSSAFGPYKMRENPESSGFGMTILDPVLPKDPPIVGIHTFPPLPGSMKDWSDSLKVVTKPCSTPDVPKGLILAGDFNTTVDHIGLKHLYCDNAGLVAHFGAQGTWPSMIPTMFGAAIDHLLYDPKTWVADQGTIITINNTDHRALLVRLYPVHPPEYEVTSAKGKQS